MSDFAQRLESLPASTVRRLTPFILGFVGGLVLLLLLLSNYYSIAPYERGIVTVAGHFSGISGPGPHFTVPFVGSVTRVPINIRSGQTDKLNTYTFDNQEVDAVLVIQYRYPETELEYIFRNVGFTGAELQKMAIDRWKIEAGKVNVSTIASSRGELTKHLLELIRSEAARLYHIDVVDVQLNNLDYADSYRDAQAKASIVKTQIEASSGLLEKAKIDAQRAQAEAAGVANQRIEQARGEAESVRLAAIAQAEAIRIKGTAEANAQKQMADALTASPQLVELRKAERWNGALPVNMYGSAPIPFMPIK